MAEIGGFGPRASGQRTSRVRNRPRQPIPVIRSSDGLEEVEAMSRSERAPLHSSGDENPRSERRKCDFRPHPLDATRAPMALQGARAGTTFAIPTRPARPTDDQRRRRSPEASRFSGGQERNSSTYHLQLEGSRVLNSPEPFSNRVLQEKSSGCNRNSGVLCQPREGGAQICWSLEKRSRPFAPL